MKMGNTRRCHVTWFGNPLVAGYVRHSAERRGTASPAGDPIALTDPSPEPLTSVTAPWGLVLEAAPTALRER